MFRQSSVDSQAPNPGIAEVEELLKELHTDGAGEVERSVEDEARDARLFVEEPKAAAHNTKKRRDLLRRRLDKVRALTPRRRDPTRKSTLAAWEAEVDELEQEVFEDLLHAVVVREGSLERIRNMSLGTRAHLRNSEKDAVERDLSRRIADLEQNITRIRKERNEALGDVHKEAAEKYKALGERDAALKKAKDAESRDAKNRDALLAKKDDEIRDLREAVGAAETADKAAKKKLKEFEDVLQAVKSSRAALVKQARGVGEEKAKLEEEKTELGDSLTKSQDALANARNKLIESRAALAETKKKLEEENAGLRGSLTESQDALANAKNKLVESRAALAETGTKLAKASAEGASKDAELLKREKASGDMAAELSRLRKEKRDALQANEEAGAEAAAARHEHDLHVQRLQDEARKALDDLAALHAGRAREMQAAIDLLSGEKQALSEQKAGVDGELSSKGEVIDRLRTEADDERRGKEKCESELGRANLEMSSVRVELQNTAKRLEEAEKRLRGAEGELEAARRRLLEASGERDAAAAELEEARGRSERDSLALTRMQEQQQNASSADRAMREGLARMFMAMARVGPRGPGIGQWLAFVEAAGGTDVVVSCGPQLTEQQDRGWTMLQQWDSQTAALPAAPRTMEGLLVGLYGKASEAGMDDEAVDLARGLVVAAETTGQVPFSLACRVAEACLDAAADSSDYHAAAVVFGLRQMLSTVCRRCSRDAGELGRRLEGVLSDRSTPLGALSALLEGDNGSALKRRIRERQEVSLPDGRVVPALYCCEGQDVGVLALPGPAGFLWALELGGNGVRRIDAARLTTAGDYKWRLKAHEGGQDIILPSVGPDFVQTILMIVEA